MDLLVPEVISLISKLGAMMVLIKAGFMSLCHSLEERMALCRPAKAKDEAAVCVLCCQKRSTIAVCDECKEHYCTGCIDTHTCGVNVVC